MRKLFLCSVAALLLVGCGDSEGVPKDYLIVGKKQDATYWVQTTDKVDGKKWRLVTHAEYEIAVIGTRWKSNSPEQEPRP